MRSTKFLSYLVCLTVLIAPIACGDPGSDEDSGSTTTSTSAGSDGELAGACATSDRVGSFELTLEDTYSGMQGRMENALTPIRIADVVDSEGLCTYYTPKSLFCDPPCASGQSCGLEGSCVDTPVAVSVGTISITGLGQGVVVDAAPPAYFYTFLGTLDHPPFAPGDSLALQASGSDEVASFVLDAKGIEPFVLDIDTVALDTGVALTLTWEPGNEDESTIHALLNIANHGGNAGWIECEFPDTGSLEIPVSLTDQLLDNGFSGFPTLILTRRSADSVDTDAGCVQFVAQSTHALNIEIDGLTSCSSDDDCIAPETCQADLTCG